MKSVVDFSGGKMDEDTDPRYLAKGSYLSLVNGRVMDSLDGDGGVVSGMKGMEEVVREPFLVNDKGEVTGSILGMEAIEDEIYVIGYGELGVGRGTFIVRYDTRNKTREVIFVDNGEKKVFPYGPETQIANIHKYENLLIFHDRNRTDPFKINIDCCLDDHHYYLSREDVKLIKAQPLYVKVRGIYNEEFGNVSSFDNNMFYFANRYVYEDGEVSAISRYSNIDVIQKKETYNSELYVVVQCAHTTGSDFYLKVKYSNKEKEVSYYSNSIVSNLTGYTYVSVSEVNLNDGSCTIAATAGQTMLLFECNYDQVVLLNTANLGDYNIGSYSNSVPTYTSINNSGTKAIYGFEYHDFAGGAKYGYLQFIEMSREGVSVLYSAMINKQVATWGCSAITFSNDSIFLGGFETFVRRYKDNSEFVNLLPNDMGTYLPPRSASFAVRNVSISADGSIIYLLLGGFNGADVVGYSIICSEDWGSTWKKKYEDVYIAQVSCSASGGVVYLVTKNEVKISTDYGNSFRVLGSISSSSRHFYSVRTYGSGQKVCVGFYLNETWADYHTFVSEDYGESFSEKVSSNYSKTMVYSTMNTFAPSEKKLNTLHNSVNEVELSYFTGNKHVKKIDLLMKVNGQMYVIKTIDKLQEKIEDDVYGSYRFKNSGLYSVVGSKDSVKMYDNVPLSARTSTIIQNALMFGGYGEGYNLGDEIWKMSVEILKREAKLSDISLKTGTYQSYGIIYYDKEGRSGPVVSVSDVYVDDFYNDLSRIRRTAKVSIYHKAPFWASYYRIARRNPYVRFDIVNGFDNVYYYNGELYVGITSMPWIVPTTGDRLQVLSVSRDDKNENVGKVLLVNRLENLLDNNGVVLELNNEENITHGKYVSPIPNGRYLVVDDVLFSGFSSSDVRNNTEKWTSSLFYVIYTKEAAKAEESEIYLETPYEYEVTDGFHKGDEDQTENEPAVILLENDGDVVINIEEDIPMEINRFMSMDLFSTLGRPNGVSDNYKHIDRFSGLCVSEPYVEDTGYNGFSSFNLSLVNYKDLEKNHRDIEKIDGFDTNVEVYQRDKVSVVQYRKNVLTTASGDKQITQSQDLFGEQQMYAADYGMDNFRSYAKSGNSRYFVDSSRGVVLRKDVNGVFPISRYGMNGYLIKALMEKGSLWGVYDGKHDSYVLCLPERAVNFFERLNGWSSFFEMVPDGICSTNSGVYSFKAGVLYEHDRTERLSIYGKDGDVVVEFVCNELPDVMKVFNAIKLESNFVPYKTEFFTHNDYSVIDSSFYEHKEGLYLTYIPMGGGEESAEYVMAGICRVSYSGIRIPLVNQEKVLVHTGDAVYVMRFKDTQPEGDKVHVGYVSEIGDGYMDLDRTAQIQAGSLVICADTSQVNGSLHRDRYIRVRMYFSTGEHMLEMKSVQVDIDESKI